MDTAIDRKRRNPMFSRFFNKLWHRLVNGQKRHPPAGICAQYRIFAVIESRENLAIHFACPHCLATHEQAKQAVGLTIIQRAGTKHIGYRLRMGVAIADLAQNPGA